MHFKHCTAVSVFKNLQSLEVCGGLITDAGVKNIKDFESPDVTQPISK